MDLTERLNRSNQILNVLDRKRMEHDDPSLGAAIERELLDFHLRELEKDIMQDPGALEPWLVRRRKR